MLRSNPQSNVVVVDWGKLSGSGVTIENQLQTYSVYLKVLKNIGPVAQRVADFLHFLKTEARVDFSQVHIIGTYYLQYSKQSYAIFCRKNYP